MAISDFTNIFTKSLRSVFSKHPNSIIQHEKKSCSFLQSAQFDPLDIPRLTGQALAMMSQTYHFTLNRPDYPDPFSVDVLGDCRVAGFAISESSGLELLLLLPGSIDPDYYRMCSLEVTIPHSQAA